MYRLQIDADGEYQRSNGTLCVRPAPRCDELFSSWLVRLAAANGAKLHSFTKAVCPEESFWSRDVDRTISSDAIRILAKITNNSTEALVATTLQSYAGILFERHNMYGTTPWLLPLGIYHRLRTAYGLQYCPRCLREHAYFKKSWRVAAITTCIEHELRLSDRCQSCEAPVLLHRSEQGSRGSFDASLQFKCFNCGGDLRRSTSRAPRANERVVDFQQQLEHALKNGFFMLQGQPYYSHLAFTGIRMIMQKLATGRHSEEFREAACRHAGIRYFSPGWNVCKPAIEHLGVDDRQRLLLLVSELLREWPATFLHVADAAGLTASSLTSYDAAVPYWYATVIKNRLNAAAYVPNTAEIQSAIAFLRNSGLEVTKTAIAGLLGNREWYRKRKLNRSIMRCLGR